MRLLILSGKGGTGKTTLAGVFAAVTGAKACADCDVDAPNLHMILCPQGEPDQQDYYGLPQARINAERCLRCRVCLQCCRFDAVILEGTPRIDPLACEGCGLCAELCPAGAITLEPAISGETRLYRSERTLSTARLRMGAGNSGKLVSQVKENLSEAAPDTPLVILDGAPGIGCPVIASLAGVDRVLVVTEPSISGFHDMKRILETVEKCGVPAAVCINKADSHPALSDAIEAYCRAAGLPFTGRIPYDPEAIRAVNRGQTLLETDGPAARAAREVVRKTLAWMGQGPGEAP